MINNAILTNIKKLGLPVLISAGVLIGVFLFIKLAFIISPFLIAILISIITEPFIRLIIRITGIKRKPAAIISLTIFLIFLGVLIFFIVWKLLCEASSVYNILPEYYTKVNLSLSALMNKLSIIQSKLPEALLVIDIDKILSNLSDNIISIMNIEANTLLRTFTSIPEAIVFVIVTLLSTFFFICDKDKIKAFFKNYIPSPLLVYLVKIKKNMFITFIGYLKAQFILMSVTFIELCIGFGVIGIKSPFFVALLISFIDSLPIIGTGCILIPWSMYCFLTDQMSTGFSLLVIYLIVLIVRQLIEPNLLGGQIGIHPLFTLIGMYAGIKLFGIPGLIAGPLSVVLIKNTLSLIKT